MLFFLMLSSYALSTTAPWDKLEIIIFDCPSPHLRESSFYDRYQFLKSAVADGITSDHYSLSHYLQVIPLLKCHITMFAMGASPSSRYFYLFFFVIV